MKFYPLVLINSTWKYEIVIIFNLRKKRIHWRVVDSDDQAGYNQRQPEREKDKKENKQPIVGSNGLFFFFFFSVQELMKVKVEGEGIQNGGSGVT
jgi:hypothetical protein